MKEKREFPFNKVADKLGKIVCDCFLHGYIHDLMPTGQRPKSYRHVAHWYLLKDKRPNCPLVQSMLVSYGRVVAVYDGVKLWRLNKFTVQTRAHIKDFAVHLSRHVGKELEVEDWQ